MNRESSCDAKSLNEVVRGAFVWRLLSWVGSGVNDMWQTLLGHFSQSASILIRCRCVWASPAITADYGWREIKVKKNGSSWTWRLHSSSFSSLLDSLFTLGSSHPQRLDDAFLFLFLFLNEKTLPEFLSE